jgi:hypothetical protein
MSPSWRVGKFRLSFSSHDRNEPMHVHVSSEKGEAKFWLNPVRLARNSGFSAAELRKAEKVVTENEEWLIDAWLTFWGEK